jgi:protoporphyrinogen oxidase
MRPYVKDQLRLGARTVGIDSVGKEVLLEDGAREPYDMLLSTMPMDLLVGTLNGDTPDEVVAQSRRLRHSGSYIVGVGIKQPAPSNKNWMYFPEDNCPFYRVTYLSNYSPEVVPDASSYYSLLCEISRSEFKPVGRACVVEETIQGLVNAKLISDADRPDIVDTHVISRDYTYPIPSLERDEALRAIHPYLESRDIYSRGRFGAWRYEVGNMDHSVAQGVEWVNRVLLDERKDELTYQGKRGC